MINRKFFLGFVVGSSAIILIILGLLAYSTSRILPQLEKESELSSHPFDKPILRIESFKDLHSIYDSLLIKEIEDSVKVYIVNYWATWCGPCIEEMDSFIKLFNKMKTSNIEFLFISEEPIMKQINFVKNKKWELPFYQFNAGEYRQNQLYPRKWPTTLVIKNKIVYLKVEQKYNWESDLTTSFINGLINP